MIKNVNIMNNSIDIQWITQVFWIS